MRRGSVGSRAATGIAVEEDELDALRFERLVARGRSLLAAGDPPGAADAFEEALGLWRGPVEGDGAENPEIARLEELRLAAVEDRVEACLALGRHRELVPELEALVAEEPLRERRRRQLMLALYRSGRQADALAAYRAARARCSRSSGSSRAASCATWRPRSFARTRRSRSSPRSCGRGATYPRR